MGNLRKSLLEMHFKDQISKTHYFKLEILRKLAAFKPKLAKIITLNRKSKEIITSNTLLR